MQYRNLKHILLLALTTSFCAIQLKAADPEISLYAYTKFAQNEVWEWDSQSNVSTYTIDQYKCDTWNGTPYGYQEHYDVTATPSLIIIYDAGDPSGRNMEIWTNNNFKVEENTHTYAVDYETNSEYDAEEHDAQAHIEYEVNWLDHTGTPNGNTTEYEIFLDTLIPEGTGQLFEFTPQRDSAMKWWNAVLEGPHFSSNHASLRKIDYNRLYSKNRDPNPLYYHSSKLFILKPVFFRFSIDT